MKVTLFMLMSLDGKISTGSSDKRDVDKDFLKINGVKEGLSQYYELEQKTDLHSLNTGKVMAKLGINKAKHIEKTPVSFIIVDNKNLTKRGVLNLIKKSKILYLVTANKNHPALKIKRRDAPSLETLYYKSKKGINFPHLFETLEKNFNVSKVTVQSGGTLNSILIREGLIDRISVVVTPCVIGGKETSTLVDGKSIINNSDLKLIKSLELVKVKKLKNSYLNLIYDVKNGK
ncbi:deaminase [archaeon]|jgi:2,5-diamino-6-(ribosylamino)-4(3H)-pyrimidinone 5'-phosphate reductase|nr:deaminase [archaeon]MBT3577799.1 deaminase [archaeon]MBT6819947.1 deaminase [archaeon]MBT7025503.1 deaminase [archaeon]MBT7238466.1 deaminase [archaeon]